MESDKFTEQESLELITKMINQAKNHYYESGLGALLWGITNVICYMLTYLSITVKGFHLPFNPFLLMIVTIIVHLYYDRKEKRKQKVKTYTDDIHNYVWTAFAICILILTIAGGYTGMGFRVLPVLLLFYGMPTFISGSISKFKPLIIGGVMCWLLAAWAFFVSGAYGCLLVAAGAMAAWVIPGSLLRIKFLKARNV